MITGAEPQLFVSDVTAACDYYARRLGFTIVFTYGEPPFYAQVARDAARLNLRHVDDPASTLSQREKEQLLAATITLDDAAPLYEEYRSAGVAFSQPLQTEPWGARTFAVRDPDGNLLLFAGSA